MFTTLVESRAVRQRSVSGTITSMVLHAAHCCRVALSGHAHGARVKAAPEMPVIYILSALHLRHCNKTDRPQPAQQPPTLTQIDRGPVNALRAFLPCFTTLQS